MNWEISTAPVRPPPGPGVRPPGFGVLKPGCSLQQALASLDSASSKMTASRLPSDHAGEPVIFRTQVRRKSSAAGSPPGPPSAHVESCASWHRSGVMNEKLAVVAADWRSVSSAPRGTLFCAHDGEWMIEWKKMNGLCRGAHWSDR